MRGNGPSDSEFLGCADAQAVCNSNGQTRTPFAFLAQHAQARRLTKLNARLESVNGQSDRSEPPPKIAVQIEKAQVQPGRRRNPNTSQSGASFPIIFARLDCNIAKFFAACEALSPGNSNASPPLSAPNRPPPPTMAPFTAERLQSVEVQYGESCGRRPKMRKSDMRLSRVSCLKADWL